MIYLVPTAIGFILLLFSRIVRVKDYRGLMTEYNSLSESDKEKYGEIIARDTSQLLTVFAFLSISLGLSVPFKLPSFIIVLIINAIVISAIYFLLKPRVYRKQNKRSVINLIGVAFIFGLIILNILGYYSTLPSSIAVADDRYEIKGMYSVDDALHNVVKIELSERLPEIKSKINGFAINNIYKGKFKVDDNIPAYLNLVSGTPPFLFINSRNVGDIYFNAETPEKTKEYYEMLKTEYEKRIMH